MADDPNGTETNTLSQLIQNETRRDGFRCHKCGKVFDKKQSLTMHLMRMHTRAGKIGASLGGKKGAATRSQRLSEAMRQSWARRRGGSGDDDRPPPGKARGRWYYRRQRERYAAQGLNAHGHPFKRGGKPSGKPGRPRTAKGTTCPVCFKGFRTRPNMTLHLRKVHGRSIIEFEPVDRFGRAVRQAAC